MILGKTYAAQRVWHPWFAWFPAPLKDGRWAWLETVERRGAFGGYLYRALED